MHFHQPAINFLAFGRKRWSLLEPHAALYSDIPARTWVEDYVGDNNNNNNNTIRDNSNSTAAGEQPETVAQPKPEPEGVALELTRRERASSSLNHLQCTQNAGDVLILPLYYGHSTLNLEASVGFAFELYFPPVATVFSQAALAKKWTQQHL